MHFNHLVTRSLYLTINNCLLICWSIIDVTIAIKLTFKIHFVLSLVWRLFTIVKIVIKYDSNKMSMKSLQYSSCWRLVETFAQKIYFIFIFPYLLVLYKFIYRNSRKLFSFDFLVNLIVLHCRIFKEIV